MAFCKDCFYHNLCNAHDELILTADELYELVYQNGVELLCKHFKRKEDVQEIKHSEWKQVKFKDGTKSCKCCMACGTFVEPQYNYSYCPVCGAKMKVGV